MPSFKPEGMWEAPPHTLAKLEIMSRYLYLWFTIIGSNPANRRLCYIDGFAGPGGYTNSDMAAANWHTYQVLTKRAERLRSLLNGKLRFAANKNHIWWGVSVENRKHGLPRIDLLRDTPAQVRFLSIEPLLEDLGAIDLRAINWVIVGGESGYGARPMEASWVRNIRWHCEKASVAFFFKQWGGVRKAMTGRDLDGRTYDEFPVRHRAPVPNLDVRRAEIQRIQTSLAH